MSCTNTPLHNELLGAVIGLARTCANNPKTDDTDRLIFTALRVSANKSANEQTLAAMIRRVNEEKAIISPGCATCTARCGNTDNYDMSLLWNAPDEIREAKLSILENAQALAEKLMQTKSEEVPYGTFPRLSNYHFFNYFTDLIRKPRPFRGDFVMWLEIILIFPFFVFRKMEMF